MGHCNILFLLLGCHPVLRLRSTDVRLSLSLKCMFHRRPSSISKRCFSYQCQHQGVKVASDCCGLSHAAPCLHPSLIPPLCVCVCVCRASLQLLGCCFLQHAVCVTDEGNGAQTDALTTRGPQDVNAMSAARLCGLAARCVPQGAWCLLKNTTNPNFESEAIGRVLG